ncbi:SAM-dependent methyltransferase [Xylophilus sp. ASV27]|uniref:SAM-dependent methyltransferase n=1 Tax=Xylophilus sp. ASV27 TaxID=2795129 RepID=UPI0018EDB77E|nr:class I SAM-dependent methyltransferase [Xylophilus sp. ASV27]
MYESLNGETPAELLALGQACIKSGDLAAAANFLCRARQYEETRISAHNLIEHHLLDGAFSPWVGVQCAIAPADDIFRFFSTHPTSINPLRDYFADGWRTLSELMLLLERIDRPLAGVHRFLEFANGHGRFTRHLVKALGADRVVVSDIVPDAVQFCRQTLGVEGVQSAVVPEALELSDTYDVVFALSLFSHLPLSTWRRWLARLYDCVAPGGVLVFTTHGAEAVRRQGVTLDANGFHFVPASESLAIDTAEYGTTFTSKDFVLARIAESMGSDRLALFSPAHFWAHQDAYVITRP